MAYHPHTDGPMPYPVPGWMWDRDLGQKLYSERMPFIRRMEDAGFDGIIFTEHYYGPNGGLTPSPMIVLSAATQVTHRIKLITMGISLALYAQPVRVAEDLAILDNLSRVDWWSASSAPAPRRSSSSTSIPPTRPSATTRPTP